MKSYNYDTNTTLRLISLAADPIGGHYVGMASRRPLTLQTRLLRDMEDLTRASRDSGRAAEYHVAPVLDALEHAMELTDYGPERRAEQAPAAFEQLSRACDYAHEQIWRQVPIPGQPTTGEAREALDGLMDTLGLSDD